VSLGDARRTELSRQLESVGPAELAHFVQFAVSTGNAALAAAVSRLASMPAKDRPLGATELAQALNLEEHPFVFRRSNGRKRPTFESA